MASRERSSSGSLFEGQRRLDEAVAAVKLRPIQRLELRALEALIAVVRPLYWLIRRLRGRPFEPTDGLDTMCDIDTTTRGTRRGADEPGRSGYLTAGEVETYERDAVLGPFDLMSEAEAGALRKFLSDTHEADWHGQFAIGQEAVDELKANGRWAINHGAIWQERNFPEIRAVACHRELASRVASLLGDEVVAWRTQVFVVDDKAPGTFWHSATTFTEDGDQPALSPPESIPAPMVNVSAWIALEDVDKRNACLRIVPGSHRDIRLDAMIQRFSKDRLGFLMSLDRAGRRAAIVALRYSGDIFLAGQVAFERALELVPDLYASARPEQYPMRAGQCLLFSSSCLHGSFPNDSGSQRLAMGVRYTSADVGIFVDQPTVPYNTGAGNRDVSTAPFNSGVPVHNADGLVNPEA